MVSTTRLAKFLDAVKSVVVFKKDDDGTIKKLFFQVIEKNEKNYEKFQKALENISKKLDSDLNLFLDSDPAVDSKEEILLAYPGYKAISTYRIAHELNELGYKLQARMLTEMSHSETGIDIHPGAKLASPLFIDHGTGIVIGETTITGKNVKIYQGVTLGALSLKGGSKLKGTKRHPTIGDNVVIYAGASILGDIAIGNNVTLGSNVFIIESIPDNVKVTLGKPELVIKKE